LGAARQQASLAKLLVVRLTELFLTRPEGQMQVEAEVMFAVDRTRPPWQRQSVRFMPVVETVRPGQAVQDAGEVELSL
jgi:hypothetical protein